MHTASFIVVGDLCYYRMRSRDRTNASSFGNAATGNPYRYNTQQQ